MTEAIPALLDEVAERRSRHEAAVFESRASTAPGFSPFEFCRNDELGLSLIIRWLLDPCGSHAQETRFLSEFLKIFGIEAVAVDWATARTEVPTTSIVNHRRRIDVRVRCDDFLIGIENKPFATFRPGQVFDYCEDLRRKTGGRYVLVILKGWTTPAPPDQIASADVEDTKIVDTDYHAVVEWLGACVQRCEAEKVRAFLSSFIEHVQQSILGVPTMEEREIVMAAVATPERRRAALDVIGAAETICGQLHRAFVAEVSRRRRRGWTVHPDRTGRDGNHNASFYNLTIDFGRELPVVFVFDLALLSGEGHGGVIRRKGVKNVSRKLQSISDLLDENVFVGNGDGRWVWWAHQSEFEEHRLLVLPDSNFWRAIVEPAEAAERVVELARCLEKQVRLAFV